MPDAGVPRIPADPVARADGNGIRKKVAAAWPQWLGPGRDGLADWLPRELADVGPREVWRAPLTSQGLGGLASDGRLVIASARDPADRNDVFTAFHLETGQAVWQVLYPAPGKLDYGNAPRATPAMAGELTVLLGAFGDLTCVRTESGLVAWRRNLVREFGAPLPTWGFCGSPLIQGDRLFIQAGAGAASLICLDLVTGEERWRSPGRAGSYSSFILVPADNRSVLVGYDEQSLGGWDAATGRRLWELVPDQSGDFNVPTPLYRSGNLWLSTENNGTRRYRIATEGTLSGGAVSQNDDLGPDTQTPLLVGNRLLGIWNGLYCLDAETLEPVWVNDRDDSFTDYASMIGCGDRVLLLCQDGQLVLIDPSGGEYQEHGRWRLVDGDCELQAFPALAGTRLVVRLARELVCLDLSEPGAGPGSAQTADR